MPMNAHLHTLMLYRSRGGEVHGLRMQEVSLQMLLQEVLQEKILQKTLLLQTVLQV